MSQLQALAAALSAPFDPKDVKFKPQMVKNNRCLAMAYIDARLIQDRLDEVLGVENWQDQYDILPDGSVMCRLARETRRAMDHQDPTSARRANSRTPATASRQLFPTPSSGPR